MNATLLSVNSEILLGHVSKFVLVLKNTGWIFSDGVGSITAGYCV